VWWSVVQENRDRDESWYGVINPRRAEITVLLKVELGHFLLDLVPEPCEGRRDAGHELLVLGIRPGVKLLGDLGQGRHQDFDDSVPVPGGMCFLKLSMDSLGLLRISHAGWELGLLGRDTCTESVRQPVTHQLSIFAAADVNRAFIGCGLVEKELELAQVKLEVVDRVRDLDGSHLSDQLLGSHCGGFAFWGCFYANFLCVGKGGEEAEC